MDERLQHMLDHYEIVRLIGDYCRGCDRLDEPLMASVYAEQSVEEHGESHCSGVEFSARTMHSASKVLMMSHMLGQTVTEIFGDEAGAETYFVAYVRRQHPGEACEVLDEVGGRYVDRLVREEGRWKIKHRTLVREWSMTTPIERNWLAGRHYITGARSGLDPSYAALRMRHGGAPSLARPPDD